MRKITDEIIASFKEYLYEKERSDNMVEKYICDIRFFYAWLGGREPGKAFVLCLFFGGVLFLFFYTPPVISYGNATLLKDEGFKIR